MGEVKLTAPLVGYTKVLCRCGWFGKMKSYVSQITVPTGGTVVRPYELHTSDYSDYYEPGDKLRTDQFKIGCIFKQSSGCGSKCYLAFDSGIKCEEGAICRGKLDREICKENAQGLQFFLTREAAENYECDSDC